jgi:hypothetical protein
MKNVTKILTAVVLCAAVFASANRIGNLGGNAAFWPGDEANITNFPAQVNNHGFVQLTNVAGVVTDQNGDDAITDADWNVAGADMVFNHNGTAWGLSFSESYDDWVNIKWGKNGMGIGFSLENSTVPGSAQVGTAASCSDGVHTTQGACEADTDCDNDTVEDDTCVWTAASGDYAAAVADVTADDYAFSYGNTFDWGELGVHYNSDGDMDFHFRKACGFWVFTDMVAHLSMPDATGMVVDADWFTHWDASGADVMFAMGFGYNEDSGAMTQTADLGIEANMTDWASFRAGVNWEYQLAGDDDVVGSTDFGWATGLGFNWGGFTADMTVADELLQDPVGNMTGNNHDGGGLTTSAMTLTYSF